MENIPEKETDEETPLEVTVVEKKKVDKNEEIDYETMQITPEEIKEAEDGK